MRITSEPASAILDKPFSNSYWLDDFVLAGEYPGADDEASARRKLQALLDLGVSCFIDLTEPADAPLRSCGIVGENKVGCHATLKCNEQRFDFKAKREPERHELETISHEACVIEHIALRRGERGTALSDTVLHAIAEAIRLRQADCCDNRFL